MDDLTRRWRSLVGAAPEATALGDDLLGRWSEPHRHYHDVSHLRAVLDAIDLLTADRAGGGADPPGADGAAPTGTPGIDDVAIRLAAWFHDAIYDGRPGADERASAALAATTLPAIGLAAHQVAEVVRLVELTAGHSPADDDRNGAVLCDADLAVLGGPPEAYAAYASGVRADYAHVPDDAFRTGRSEVLASLLARDPLFHTSAGRRRWERTARRNLRTELDLLRLG